MLSFWCILSLAWSCHVVVILVQFGHCVVIVLSLWCHLGALDDCHCVVIFVKNVGACWSCSCHFVVIMFVILVHWLLVILLTCCCHVGPVLVSARGRGGGGS